MIYTDEQQSFLAEHMWAILATARRDGTPQQSMVGYTLDPEGRVLISTRRPFAKWHNILRTPAVSLTVPDGTAFVVIYGRAEPIDTDPQRAELSADVLGVVRGPRRPDPATIIGWLDEEERVVIRITPEKTLFHP
jgi:PPOX class probable F420-dependent enzyme